MNIKEMWGVSYFWIPCGRWYSSRVYTTLDKAVDDFIKLSSKEDVGAVRLYEPGHHPAYHPTSGYLWHDEKINQFERQKCANAAAMLVE